VAGFVTVAAITGFGLGILNSLVGVINLWRRTKEAVRTRQRTLRGDLRDILREIAEACTEYEYGQPQYLNPELLSDSARKLQRLRALRLQRLRDEGLLSPGDTHLEQLQTLLREIERRWHVPTQLPPVPAAERQRLLQVNQDRMDSAVARVHARARTYMTATTKMDNGSYLAYLRWKRLGLFKSQGA
jgi:hypothetical protein